LQKEHLQPFTIYVPRETDYSYVCLPNHINYFAKENLFIETALGGEVFTLYPKSDLFYANKDVICYWIDQNRTNWQPSPNTVIKCRLKP
jgi:hypothetical protein